MILRLVALAAGLAFLAGPSAAQAPDSMQHMHHMHGVEARGDKAMGFSHASTTHHFLLFKDGGAVVATVNDPGDTASLEHIRTHLPHVAHAFAAGDFSMPMFIHGQVPPGVPVMKRRHSRIDYSYEPIANGGRVRITTRDPRALAAVHDFLRFQVRDHQTGDPLTVQPDPGR